MFVGLFAQHTAEKFIKLFSNKGELALSVERTWVAQHRHDDEVTSIAIERGSDVNIQQLNDWLSQLLAEKGVDIFRLKGFISIADDPRRFVFQGVHMLIDSQPERLWKMPRKNQLVFIGRNLDEEAITAGFDRCLVH